MAAAPALSTKLGGTIGFSLPGPAAPGTLSAAGGARRAAPELVVPFALPTLRERAKWQERSDRERERAEEQRREEQQRREAEDGEAEPAEAQPADEADSTQAAQSEGKGKGKQKQASPGPEVLSIADSAILLQSLRQSRLLHLTSLLPVFSTRQRNGITYPQTQRLPRALDPRKPHVLLQLGRIEIRCGPHVFGCTKVWEVREEEPKPGTAASASASSSGGASSAAPATAPISSSSKHVPFAPSRLPSAHTAPAPAPAPAAPKPRPPISPALVTRVNEKAATDPALQALLHAAASGSATSEQLHHLGVWIGGVTEELRKEGLLEDPKANNSAGTASSSTSAQSKASTQAASATNGQQPPSRGPASKGPAASAPNGSSSAPSSQPAPGAPKPSSSAPSAASTSAAAAPAPPAPVPILILEYRENPSARFTLPIWRDAIIERRTAIPAAAAGAVSTKTGAGTRAAGSRAARGSPARVKITFFTPLPGSEALPAGLKDAPPARVPITWTLEGVSEALWDAFGRFEACRTWDEKGVEVQQRESAVREEAIKETARLVAALPRQKPLAYSVPAALIPKGLEEHLSDKFGVRISQIAGRPSAKRKIAGGAAGAGLPSLPAASEEKAQGGGAAGTGTSNASRALFGGPTPLASSSTAVAGGATGEVEPPKKRKRHVATHNPDGSRKSCGACGTLSTPMWRRGPAGPSQLCNACGARWKAGRLVVPDVPPPPKYDEEKPVRRSASKAGASTAAEASSSAAKPASTAAPASTSAAAAPVVAASSSPMLSGPNVTASISIPSTLPPGVLPRTHAHGPMLSSAPHSGASSPAGGGSVSPFIDGSPMSNDSGLSLHAPPHPPHPLMHAHSLHRATPELSVGLPPSAFLMSAAAPAPQKSLLADEPDEDTEMDTSWAARSSLSPDTSASHADLAAAMPRAPVRLA